MMLVTYYEFVAVLEYRRYKVIVKQLPGGERMFWSSIAFWRQDRQGRRLPVARRQPCRRMTRQKPPAFPVVF